MKDFARTEEIANTLVQYSAKIVEHNDDFMVMQLSDDMFKISYGDSCIVNNGEKRINNKEELLRYLERD